MYSSTVLLAAAASLSLLAGTASAMPSPGSHGPPGHTWYWPWSYPHPSSAGSPPAVSDNCLTDAEAQTIIDGFVNMLENTMEDFNVTLAETMLSEDFVDYSDSINYLKRTPLGAPAFESRQAFIEGQGTQPPFPSVDTLNMFHTCDAIAWRWQGNYEPLPIRGVNMFFVNEKKQVKAILVEMNSGAFLKNVGKPECNSSIAYYQ